MKGSHLGRQARRRVESVPDPEIRKPTDAADADPLGIESFATHHVSLTDGPRAYEMFQQKEDGAVKVVFRP